MLETREISRLPLAAELFFRYAANIAKKSSVLNPGEHLEPLRREIAVLVLGWDVFKRETWDRHSRKWHISLYKFWELPTAAREGIKIEGEMALADRTANEVREAAINDKEKGRAWALAKRARENPLCAGHGHPHERRIERLAEIIIMSVKFLRHGPENIRRWIQMPFLQSWTHDLDEVVTEQRNLDGEPDLKPKAGHAEAGGVNAWLLLPFLEKAGEYTHKEAVRLTAGTIVGNMLHDKPELKKKRLTSRGTAAALRHKPEDLFDAWQKGQVNIFSFTLADMMTVARLSKAKAGFVTEKCPNGLEPAKEEIYRKRLETMAADTTQTFEEMLGFTSEDDKKAFLHTLNVLEIADLADMLVPPRESLLRKLLVPLNKTRPLIRKTDDIEKFVNDVQNGLGNVLPEQDSTLRRILWEIFHNYQMIEKSVLGKDPFMQNFFYSLYKDNIDFIEEIFSGLLVNHYDGIERIYINRLENIRRKAAKKGDDQIVWKRLAQIETDLEKEKDTVIAVLRVMPVSNLNGGYDVNDIEFLKRCIVKAKQRINVPPHFSGFTIPYGWDTLSLGRPKVVHAEAVFNRKEV